MHDDEDAHQYDRTNDAQNIIQNRMGQSYSFYMKARDVVKYLATPGCPGCKFATGVVNTQRGHSPECKNIMMLLMSQDREDKHRVKQWYIQKGIDESKDDGMGNEHSNKRGAGDDAGSRVKSRR